MFLIESNLDHTHYIIVEVWDEDTLKDDEFIGYTMIPISSISECMIASRKFKLGKKSSEKAQGFIQVRTLYYLYRVSLFVFRISDGLVHRERRNFPVDGWVGGRWAVGRSNIFLTSPSLFKSIKLIHTLIYRIEYQNIRTYLSYEMEWNGTVPSSSLN